MFPRQITKQILHTNVVHRSNSLASSMFRLATLNSSRCFSNQYYSRLFMSAPPSSSTTEKTTTPQEETPASPSSEQAVDTTLSAEQSTATTPSSTETQNEQSTIETPFNLQATASLIMDSAETLKQKREMLQKELESRKDAEVMLKRVIYRGIRAFGVLFVAVCLLIWAVKRKNLEAKVKKFNDKIKKSEEKEQELEKELETNFAYIKKDIESKNTSTNN